MPKAVPNYLRTGSGGSIFAVFPGGVEIPTQDQQVGISPIRPGVGVIWKQQADGSVLADITTTVYHKAGGAFHEVDWDLTVTTDPNDSVAPGGVSGLHLVAGNGARKGANVYVTAQNDVTIATGFTKLLVDDQGRSDFIQAISSGQLAINGGAFNWSFSGGTSAMVIPHQLGRTPLFAFAVAEVGTGFLVGYGAFSYNSINFTAAARESTLALGGSIPGHWFAFG